MNDILVRCTCLRMVGDTEIVCNEPFQRKDAEGNWYWCLYCDAHWSECGNKGGADYADCPPDPPPPCRISVVPDVI